MTVLEDIVEMLADESIVWEDILPMVLGSPEVAYLSVIVAHQVWTAWEMVGSSPTVGDVRRLMRDRPDMFEMDAMCRLTVVVQRGESERVEIRLVESVDDIACVDLIQPIHGFSAIAGDLHQFLLTGENCHDSPIVGYETAAIDYEKLIAESSAPQEELRFSDGYGYLALVPIVHRLSAMHELKCAPADGDVSAYLKRLGADPSLDLSRFGIRLGSTCVHACDVCAKLLESRDKLMDNGGSVVRIVIDNGASADVSVEGYTVRTVPPAARFERLFLPGTMLMTLRGVFAVGNHSLVIRSEESEYRVAVPNMHAGSAWVDIPLSDVSRLSGRWRTLTMVHGTIAGLSLRLPLSAGFLWVVVGPTFAVDGFCELTLDLRDEQLDEDGLFQCLRDALIRSSVTMRSVVGLQAFNLAIDPGILASKLHAASNPLEDMVAYTVKDMVVDPVAGARMVADHLVVNAYRSSRYHTFKERAGVVRDDSGGVINWNVGESVLRPSLRPYRLRVAPMRPKWWIESNRLLNWSGIGRVP